MASQSLTIDESLTVPYITEPWTTVETGEFIDLDLETNPLEIRSDSLDGDDSLIDVALYEESATQNDDYIANINIRFGDVPTYKISSCVTSETNFSTTLPTEQEKIWKIIKSDTELIILCNGIEVVNVSYSDYSETCANAWNRDVAKILFYPGNDTASANYRPVPG